MVMPGNKIRTIRPNKMVQIVRWFHLRYNTSVILMHVLFIIGFLAGTWKDWLEMRI